MSSYQQYASDILYHFVGCGRPNADEENFAVLCAILESGQVRCRKVGSGHPVAVQVDYDRNMEKGELVVQSVVCFCDIHLKQLPFVHSRKYGRFGVGVDLQTFAQDGGRPVIYMPRDPSPGAGIGNDLGRELLNVHRALSQFFLQDTPASHSRTIGALPSTPIEAASQATGHLAKDVLAFLKYYDLGLPEGDERNYYMEREWRKYGPFELHHSLRHVVVAPGYGAHLRQLFPRLAADIIEQ